MRLILRWAINAVALYVAIILLPQYLTLQGGWANVIWLALIFGLVNAIIRPPVKALSCLFIILSLGLFTFVINALLFALTGWLGTQFGVGLILSDPWFLSAFLGSLITTAVSVVLSFFLRKSRKSRKK
jgi:putative membrane protein